MDADKTWDFVAKEVRNMAFIHKVITFIEKFLAIGSTPLFLAMGQGRLPGVIQTPAGQLRYMDTKTLQIELEILNLPFEQKICDTFAESITELRQNPRNACMMLQDLAKKPPTDKSFCIRNNLAIAYSLNEEADNAYENIQLAVSLFGNKQPGRLRGVKTALNDNRVKIKAQRSKPQGG